MTSLVQRFVLPAVVLVGLAGLTGPAEVQASQDRSDVAAATAESPYLGMPHAEQISDVESALLEPAALPAWSWEAVDLSGVHWPYWRPCGDSARLWMRGRYLLWWTKGNPLPALVSSSAPDAPRDQAGIPGSPGFEVLLGDQDIADRARGGGFLTFGYWFHDHRDIGAQIDWFLVGTDQHTKHLGAASDGVPILARPFDNVVTGQPDAALIAFPGVVAGAVETGSFSEVYSGAILLRKHWRSGLRGRIDLLGGYRLFGLREGLTIAEGLVSLDPDGVVPPDTTLASFDRFTTKNRFHGGEFGVHAEWFRGCWSFDLLGKVALGYIFQELTIDGSTPIRIPGPEQIDHFGGLLTQPTNIGVHRRNDVGVLPELGVNLHYHVTDRCRLSLGYSLVCLNSVLRTGGQIDTAVNPTHLAGFDQPHGGELAGSPRPAVLLRDASFWAQGLGFGLQLAR